MSTYPEILEAALALPPSQRGELAEVLWASLPDSYDDVPPLSEEWRAEIARRSAEIDAGTAKLMPWELWRERAEWRALAEQRLGRAYSDDEPEYTADDV